MTAVGIDLGTTFSCVAFYKNNQITIIPTTNSATSYVTPSCVAFTPDGVTLVGEEAKNQMASNPKGTIFDAKRLIGRLYDDKSVREDSKTWPFDIIRDIDGKQIRIVLTEKKQIRTLLPEEISAIVLKRIKQIAENFLHEPILGAVITVPAYFNDSQRQATLTAAHLAEIEVLGLINEPTAAALAYGLEHSISANAEGKNKTHKILVFDLGGGTLDVTILKISKNNKDFEVLSTSGDTHLGGQDFTNRLVSYFLNEANNANKRAQSVQESTAAEAIAVRRLLAACERIKRTLSDVHNANIEIDNLFQGYDFHGRITREQFENCCMDLFHKTLAPIRRALTDACLRSEEIDDVVLVGGSSRIPKVRELVQEAFNGRELKKSINPDEAIAYGAAVHAAVLAGDSSSNIKNLTVVDVLPMSLGIRVYPQDQMSIIVKRNTKIPVSFQRERYITVCDNQKSMAIDIFEGEEKYTKENHLLGHFLLENLPRKLKGKVQVEVSMRVDVNGILFVSAVEISTGEINQISIKKTL